ncbi:MAG TPA: uroporphyrinogen decarboxylase family protein [Candidatus Limnocylindrales bacterium]|nr:uroporphyrinogen decarboxylase family protein [Candidatus Limnocylindrales bacterium]
MDSPRSTVLAHLDGRPVTRLPVMPITMMFAARLSGIPYRRYCTDFRELARGQALVAERFGFDHVSAISDPAREAVDLGAAVTWFEDQPPALDDTRSLLVDKATLAGLGPADPLGGGRMTDRLRGVELLRATGGATRLVEGWVEGPCAEAADLRGIGALMLDFADDPGFVDDLFGLAVRQAITFAQAQVDAGADIIGVGDAAASLVGPAIYREVVAPHEQRLVDAIHAMGARVRLHICGNTRRSVDVMAGLGADIVDLDSLVPLDRARADAGPRQVLLGNLNPVTELMSATPGAVTSRVAACHAQAGPRFIVGAGCEIPAATPHENVDALAAYARATPPDATPGFTGA